jgi:hypothetical protein
MGTIIVFRSMVDIHGTSWPQKNTAETIAMVTLYSQESVKKEAQKLVSKKMNLNAKKNKNKKNQNQKEGEGEREQKK